MPVAENTSGWSHADGRRHRALPSAAAMDVGQMTFEAAFASFKQGKGPDDPRKLAQWLIGIAKNRRLEYLRQERRAGTAALPGNLSFDDLPDDAESRSGRAGRAAHVQRLLKTVVATLEERDRLIYKLRFEQELAGRDVAKHLGVSEKTGSNEVTKVQHLVVDGFGALILAREGRPYCRDLARILDEAAFTGENYTSALRQRLVRHFSTCATCDNCPTCADKRRELVGPYVPGVIPVLFGAEFDERIAAGDQPRITAGHVTRPAETPHAPTRADVHPCGSPEGADYCGDLPGRNVAGHRQR
jgi:RNA polymerase sigma factor (sigma-70 family)